MKNFDRDRGSKKKPGKDSGGFRVNREIYAAQVRVIGDDGKMLGVMTVTEAVRLAEDRGLDLIEIAPTAVPPTCKIMDYGKWKYEEKKKQQSAKKNQVVITIKEIQLRPRTDKHDLDTKIKNARRFLMEGDKVKVSLRFLGREMAHQEFGIRVMDDFIKALTDIALIETSPKFEGKQMFALIGPDPAKIKVVAKAEKVKAPSAPTPEAKVETKAEAKVKTTKKEV